MKVLVLAPPGRTGGIQRYTATLVRALKDLLGDHCVRCAAIPEVRDGSRHGRFSMRLKLRFGCKALWEAVRWRPDLTICTHLGLGPIGWLLANLGRRPYWIVVHGLEAWGLLPYWKRMGVRQADRVIVTSAFSREQVVKRHQIGSERISSLPCALDERLLTVEPARNGLHRSLSGGPRVVLTVARMAASERYKGHDVVLRAMASVVARIPNVTYVVVGGGDDRARLEALTDELGLRGHVVFTGEVSDSDVAALYQRSEVFVLPARTVLDDRSPKGEGFGIVFLEAMAFGKPVVGPNCGAPAELIRHGENGLLVIPEDPASVAEALVHLLTNPVTAREMGKAGSDWVRRHYSYGSFRERLRDLLPSPTKGGRENSSRRWDSVFDWTPAFWQGWREAPNPYRRFKSECDRSLTLEALQLGDGERVLEVGCGYGFISRALLGSAKIRWVGLDRSESMVRKLRASLPELQPDAFIGDAHHLPFPADSFDKVLCTGVLMHVNDEFPALKEMARVLRPGGVLLCSMNNALSPFSLPVRLKNSLKKGFIQNFRLPRTYCRHFRHLGLRLLQLQGDSIFATISLQVGPYSFPPSRAFSTLRALDQWAVRRFAWLAYEVWFKSIKLPRPQEVESDIASSQVLKAG